MSTFETPAGRSGEGSARRSKHGDDASTTLSVRLSYAEKRLLVEAASRRGVGLSEFVRRAGLLDAAVVDFVHNGAVQASNSSRVGNDDERAVA